MQTEVTMNPGSGIKEKVLEPWLSTGKAARFVAIELKTKYEIQEIEKSNTWALYLNLQRKK